MKKTLVIILIAIVVILTLAIAGITIFLKTFDLNRYKPQIINAAQSALGRQVDFKEINAGFSLVKGIKLELSGLEVGEDERFGKIKFILAQKASLNLSIMDLITKRQVRILGIEIVSAQVRVIRLKDGLINVQALGESLNKGEDGQKQRPKAAALPVIFINKLNVSDSRIYYIDHLFSPALNIRIDRIQAGIKDFSLTDDFSLNLSVSFAGDETNISGQGIGRINLSDQTFLIRDFTADSDLSLIQTQKLTDMLPMLKGVPLPEITAGKLSVSINEFKAGAAGLLELKGRGELSGGELKMQELAEPVKDVQAEFKLSKEAISIDNASLLVSGGKVGAEARLEDYLESQGYSLSVNADGIDLSRMFADQTLPIKVQGRLSAESRLKGQGFTALKNLQGQASFEMTEGKLVNLNVLKNVLDRLPLVGNLVVTLQESLPQNMSRLLKQKDTNIKKAAASANIGQEQMLVNNLKVDAEGFEFTGQGKIGFNAAYSLRGQFIVPKELSSEMTESVPELEYLLNQDERIAFPLTVSGIGAGVKFLPDVAEMGVGAIKRRGLKELEKIFGPSEQPTRQQDDQSQDQPLDQRERAPSTLEGIFEGIFGQ